MTKSIRTSECSPIMPVYKDGELACEVQRRGGLAERHTGLGANDSSSFRVN